MNRGVFIDRQRKGVGVREDGIFFFLAHASVFQKNEKKNKTTSVRPCTGYITEITPKSPLLCVQRSHIRYGFRTGAKSIRCSVNTHPYHAENCYHSYVWIPWVPEAFHARFPFSVSLKKWPARKASPLVSSAFGRTRVGLGPTKRSSPSHVNIAREKQPLVPRVMCERKPRSGKWKVKRRKVKWKI